MTEKTIKQLSDLGAHLKRRRDAILQAWLNAARSDPAQTTVSHLTGAQFNDHIPQLLDAFEAKLCSRPGGGRAKAADDDKTHEDLQHGLQRWQQGYRLTELMHEWGHLHRCLAREINDYLLAYEGIQSETLAAAHDELTALISEGINQSAGAYASLQQAEASGHLLDLQLTLAKVSEIEQRRVTLIHQAVHDLRANVQSVSSAADLLGEKDVTERERTEFAKLVQDGIESVAEMLGELMVLARLEAGQEPREIEAFDAAKVLNELCLRMRPVAVERQLFLKSSGAEALVVEGDAGKIHRLAQNLLVNALKYTVTGGVTVSWGEDKQNWWIMVKDTGPGLRAGPGAPIAFGMKEATVSARESDERAAVLSGQPATVLPVPPGGAIPARRLVQRGGEGIGLSIVKRLCELLDASLELASSADAGTTFRVVLPRRYPGFSNPPKG